MKIRTLIACAIFTVLIPANWQVIHADQPWISHTSFADFAAGTPGDGGTNLYVTRAGQVEMINRLDFNNDGYLDLFVANDHDSIEGADVLVYWGTSQGPRSLLPPLADQLPKLKLLNEVQQRRNGALRLPSDGGGRSILADLNNDGYEEIIFCNFKHNYTIYSNALIYWNSPEGFRADRRTELPTLLPGGVVAADFNQDGFVDLAFANRGNFEWLPDIPPHGHLESYVYWNGPTGFDVRRRTSLPASTAVDCAAEDINHDGYPELMFVNNNRQEKSVYLYWGGADGFSVDRRTSWKSHDPVSIRIADLDGDHEMDLALLHKNNQLELFYGNGQGFEMTPRVVLPTVKALQCAVGDLNMDGMPELVVANQHTESFIYWGSQQGFSATRRTALPSLQATDVTLADFNHDGRTDIVFSNTSDGKTHDVNSYIYWNGPDGFSAASRKEVLGFSPDSANAGDLNHDGHQDLVLVSHISGGATAPPLQVYWGNSRHHYSPSSMASLPNTGAVAITDIDQDGHVDVVGVGKGMISHGGPDGFAAPRPLFETAAALEGNGVDVADLNRDGYLDLVLSQGSRVLFPDEETHQNPTRGTILWGGENGYDSNHRTELKLETLFSQSVNIADLNKDGFLDLLFPGIMTGNTHIFWGASDGSYTDQRQTMFQAHNASTVEIADLNQDGWLDLIFGGGWNLDELGHPTTFALVMWGGADGYHQEKSLRLESFDSLESSVADVNNDGHLDIILSNYHAYFTRRIPAFIYWGAADGSFRESRRSTVPAESSSALTIADYNQDGWVDLFLCNHVFHGDHTIGSNLFWGGPDGFSKRRSQWVPTFGPHFGLGWDVGNIYDRRLEEDYLSAPLECPTGQRPARLQWQAATPHDTAVRFQIRSAETRRGLSTAKWTGPQGQDGYFEHSGSPLQVAASARWLQYRAVLSTPDGGSTPMLKEVRLRSAAVD